MRVIMTGGGTGGHIYPAIAIADEIRAKGAQELDQQARLGTTPRQLTDLIGSLCDLTSGSGDKGTPFVYIQGYFDTYVAD